MATEAALTYWLETLSAELDRRIPAIQKLDRYYEGRHDLPIHLRGAPLASEYRELYEQSISNWPLLIVRSVEQRLEVTGFRFGDETQADQDAWRIYEANGMGSVAPELHEQALVSGRAFATVWAGPDGAPQITPDHPSTTVVAYEQGTRDRIAALRRWREGKRWMATLYLPDGIYKFQSAADSYPVDGEGWERRELPGEPWPLPNPLVDGNGNGIIPVVEFAVNRSLRPKLCGTASGEFERVLAIIDRCNAAVAAASLAQSFASWPVRALIGEKIRTDEDGNPTPPFDVALDRLVQIEDPNASLTALPAAPLEPFVSWMRANVEQLAAITQTPTHTLTGAVVNLSADAIRAAEQGLVSKIRRHQLALSDAHEDLARLSLLVANPGDPRAYTPDAEVIWRDPESRSLAEQADSAAKLGTVLPWQALAQKILSATPQEIAQWEAQRASDQLSALMSNPQPPAA